MAKKYFFPVSDGADSVVKNDSNTISGLKTGFSNSLWSYESIETVLRRRAVQVFDIPEKELFSDVPLTNYAENLLDMIRFQQLVEQDFAGTDTLAESVHQPSIASMTASLATGKRERGAVQAPVLQWKRCVDISEKAGWVRLYSEEKGRTRPLVLCFPYAGGEPHMFQKVANHLGRQCDVRIARYASSDDTGPLQPIESLARILVDNLDDNRPVILLGHCYGAYMAHAVAREMRVGGQKVHGVVVAGATPPDAQELVYARSRWSSDSEDDATLEYLKEIYAPLLTDMSEKGQTRYWVEYKQAVRRMERYDFGTDCMEIPCLVVTGESEEYPFVVEFSPSWKRCFSLCHFVDTPGGHLFVQTHAETFAEAVLRFIQDITEES
ncbi:thioesterase II family protein [Pseudodesulfovibrio piezophilus]|uniref:Thioesterase TesA-like domain-containing protein n=1 Tax=Pseudodesulfovibrio piezophilus (strain DSM 21447 / JCM 15486 / C1TLV30) TaxID=1322246 RepID=M1WVI1_PSEP2|nr:alpha/beta fold hydrolase [Pseudodesulfovibrio piezophilus]CCH48473.1 protein of unknown function [Pseudodesulfovibrio piezophilus C1TLV30]